MARINSFAQAHEALAPFITPAASTNYTLDEMNKFMHFLGDPQDSLKIIHVAGTSGKTSTSYFAAAVLSAAGYKVGLTTSPHIDEINERVQIDLVPLPEKKYCKLMSEFLGLVAESGLKPSYFELLVAFAYWVFAREGVDYAVIEVGLGGLLDATNVIHRQDKVCVITDIGLDHTHVLGGTVEEIAAQKAGIITPGNAVFMHSQVQSVMEVVQQSIGANNATLNVIGGNFNNDIDPAYELFPAFQKRNFTLAFAAASFTLQRDGRTPLTPAQLHQAIGVYIPARMEVVEYEGSTLVMDGSHNEQKIEALVQGMSKQFVYQDIALLVSFGTLKLPSVLESLKLLRQLSPRIIVTKYTEGQDEKREALDPTVVAGLALDAGFTTVLTEADPLKAFEMLLADKAPVHLITGSFYLLNHYRPLVFKK
jgi:dihydrofolate synthase/folylpolyglutamate synthase